MRLRVCVAFLFLITVCRGDDAGQSAKQPSKGAAKLDSQATPADRIKVAKGFEVELVYSVPKDRYGTWVNLTPDPQGAG